MVRPALLCRWKYWKVKNQELRMQIERKYLYILLYMSEVTWKDRAINEYIRGVANG